MSVAERDMIQQGHAKPAGHLGLVVIRKDGTVERPHVTPKIVVPSLVPERELSAREVLALGSPHKGLPDAVNQWRRANVANLLKGYREVQRAQRRHLPFLFGRLSLAVIRKDGGIEDLGLASFRVVTDAGVAAIVDAFQGTFTLSNLKYHGLGTTNTAEAASQTTLAAELTTQYNPDNTRATGNLGEGATANIFRTVGTNTVDASVAIVEHAVFSQAATGGGTMLDRSIFASVSLSNADSLQTTYDLTFSSGG